LPDNPTPQQERATDQRVNNPLLDQIQHIKTVKLASKSSSYNPSRSDSMSNKVFLKQLMNRNGQFGDLYGNFDVVRKQAVLIKNSSDYKS
jgi:hypothetical protein